MTIDTVGWDIGGAHIKVAVLDHTGCIVRLIQRECPLWKGLALLNQNMQQILAELNIREALHAVTMTGELVDLFDNRDEGVAAILGVVSQELLSDKTLVFTAGKGFLPVQEVSSKDYRAIASANWLASGLWLAEIRESGLIVDIGSTTTDFILIEDNKVMSRGYSDFDRMRYDELVYTGVVRTPVMAIADTVPFEGESVGVIAEHFATMADIYRLTGELPDYADQWPAADGGEKDNQGSTRRLARMIGRDLASADHSMWNRLARYLRERQLAKIQSACEKQLSRSSKGSHGFIGAGVGKFLVKDLAIRCGASYIDFSTLFPQHKSNDCFKLSDCAPVVSVASLMRQTVCR